jgi:hypothetical protein
VVDYFRVPNYRKALTPDINSEDDAVRLITEILRTIVTESVNKQTVTVEITLKITLKS